MGRVCRPEFDCQAGRPHLLCKPTGLLQSPPMTRIGLILLLFIATSVAETIQSDLVVYGGTAGGVAAAVQASREGKTVVLLEFGHHLGGMTSGGLGQTDIGNKAGIGG